MTRSIQKSRPIREARPPLAGPAGPFHAPGAWRDSAFVVAAALALRIWHLAEFSAMPFFRALQMDARFHAAWAQALLERNWADPQVYFRAPFYPYFLAALQSLTGEVLWTARIAQILAGAGTVLLAHRLALRLFSPRWALAAGLLAALLWVPIHYETELLLEPILTFQTTLLLYLMVRAADRPPGRGGWLAWGLLLGVAAITRPNALIFAPALPVYAAWAASRRGAREARLWPRIWPGWRPAAFLLAGFLLPVLPVWLHNARQGDPSTVLAWQGGINLYIGNNPESNGWSAIAPGMRTDWRGSYQDAIRVAQERSSSPRPLRPSEVSSFWTREAARFWSASPGQAVALTARKVLLFWGSAEIRNNEDPEFFHRQLVSLRWNPVSFGLLAPWVLCGLALSWRRDGRWRLLALFVVAWFLSIVPFFVTSRYRLPITPLLPLFALLTVRTAAAWVRARSWRQAGLIAATAAVLYALLLPARAGVRDGRFFQAWNNTGDAWSELRRWEEAAAAYRRALESNPNFVSSHNNLGLALEALGRWQEAEKAYRDGLEAVPGHPTVVRNLAQVLERQGRLEEAEQILAGQTARAPEDWESALLLARVQEVRGAGAAARRSLEALLARSPDVLPARLRLANLLRQAGELDLARAVVAEGLRRAPGHPELLRAQAALAGRGMER